MSTALRRPRAELLATVAVCAAAISALAALQFSFDPLYDKDSYFHARASQQLWEHGVQRHFEQAAISTWAEHYSDKDLLFHVALWPFTASGGELVMPGKRAAVALAGALLLATALVCHAIGIRYAGVWIALALVSKPYVILHLLSLRPYVLGTLFWLVELALLLTKRPRALLFVCALHVWAHSSFALVPVLVLAHLAASAALRQPLPWRSSAAAAAGLLLGNVVHPYAPNNWLFAWNQIVGVATHAWSVSSPIPSDLFGAELAPMSLSTLLFDFAPGWLPLAAAMTALAWARKRPSLRTTTLALVSLAFTALALRSYRFLPPLAFFASLAAGSAWTELARDRPLGVWMRLRGGLAAAGLLAACAALGIAQLQPARLPAGVRGLAGEVERFAQPPIDFLREQALPDELVFHPTWREFATLYHYRPEGRYVYALDPIFLYAHDPLLFARIEALRRGEAPDPYALLAGELGARWVYLPRQEQYAALYASLQGDSRFGLAFAGEGVFVLEVRSPAEP